MGLEDRIGAGIARGISDGFTYGFYSACVGLGLGAIGSYDDGWFNGMAAKESVGIPGLMAAFYGVTGGMAGLVGGFFRGFVHGDEVEVEDTCAEVYSRISAGVAESLWFWPFALVSSAVATSYIASSQVHAGLEGLNKLTLSSLFYGFVDNFGFIFTGWLRGFNRGSFLEYRPRVPSDYQVQSAARVPDQGYVCEHGDSSTVTTDPAPYDSGWSGGDYDHSGMGVGGGDDGHSDGGHGLFGGDDGASHGDDGVGGYDAGESAIAGEE